MRTLHEAHSQSEFQARLRALTSNSQRRWGKMSVDQMLWHVNSALCVAMGEFTIPPQSPPLPRRVMLFLALNMPWPKGAPTLAPFVARQPYDFTTEHARCCRLVEKFGSKSINEPWPINPVFGKMSGQQISRLQAKHLDHHLRQFGV